MRILPSVTVLRVSKGAVRFRRRSMLLALLILLGGLSLCLGGVLYLVKQEPDFYRRPPAIPDRDARDRASKLLTRWQDLKNDIRTRPVWGDTFTAEDLNSFFVENLGSESSLCAMLPDGFHSPRVSIDGDRLRFGLRYRQGFWSTVLWVELRVWLVKDETNLVAVEVCNLAAGRLPVGSQSILDWVTETARDSNIEVTWYRSGNNPVGLFRFYADQARPSSQILTLEVENGKIAVAGQSFLGPSVVPPAGVP